MNPHINPDPDVSGLTPRPLNCVTAVVDRYSDVVFVVRSLGNYGFLNEQVSVFVGPQGLAKLEHNKEEHRILAGVLRTLEWLAPEDQARPEAEAALREGHIFISVSTDGTDHQKDTVERILKIRGARHIRFFSRWTVERL